VFCSLFSIGVLTASVQLKGAQLYNMAKEHRAYMEDLEKQIRDAETREVRHICSFLRLGYTVFSLSLYRR
jgi:hypothetical protein